MILKLIVMQIIAHVMSDYFFQTDASAKEKNDNGFKSKFLPKHILITFICSWILSFDVNFVFCSLGIAITHYIIDGSKKSINTSKYSLFIDQIAHLAFIILFIFLFEKYFISNMVLNIDFTEKNLILILFYLICMKPANIIIREIFNISNVNLPSNNNTELENAGKLIGILERILVLTLVLMGEYEAIGFLIAAKSILRYSEGNTTKTEYVLIGTMASFTIAMSLGIIYSKYL